MPNYNLFEELKSYGLSLNDSQLEAIKAAAEKDGANVTGNPDALNIKLFKKQFLLFANSQGYAKGCTGFISQLEACETPERIMRLFKSYSEDFAEALDIEEGEVDDLKEEVSELKDEVEDLEAMLGGVDLNKHIDRGTILFQWKVKLFFENIGKYSHDELKELFENKKQKAA